MLDPPFGPMEEKMISEMTARQHKAEVGKRAHDVNCGDSVMLEKSKTTGSTQTGTLKQFSGVSLYHEVI